MINKMINSLIYESENLIALDLAIKDMYETADYQGSEEWANEYRDHQIEMLNTSLEIMKKEFEISEDYEKCAVIKRIMDGRRRII